MTSLVLLGKCVCGEPVFRHRILGRQISCARLRQIDQALKASGTGAQQTIGARDSRHSVSDGIRQGGVR